ncbi:hypothetical protein IE53DRAFT_5504 [Violaceomyces palustris]|uniref:Uncharacterized protein n=1 Tax=Violaceomyces palustris TaxID=1673888 RepID=A0ACD0NLV3_9BASI|nr:hypothetical protein IE53DRAFT_5504 [Violaceomyces palustris]
MQERERLIKVFVPRILLFESPSPVTPQFFLLLLLSNRPLLNLRGPLSPPLSRLFPLAPTAKLSSQTLAVRVLTESPAIPTKLEGSLHPELDNPQNRSDCESDARHGVCLPPPVHLASPWFPTQIPTDKGPQSSQDQVDKQKIRTKKIKRTIEQQ